MIVAGYANRDRILLKIASVYATVPPKASSGSDAGRNRKGAIDATAPWALSVVPECLQQIAHVTGKRSYVLAHLPNGFAAVAAGTQLVYADCTVTISSNQVVLRRGHDELVLPAGVRLLKKGSDLATLLTWNDRADLRLFVPGIAGR